MCIYDATTQLDSTKLSLQLSGYPVGLYVHGSTIFANHVPNDLDLIAIVEEFGCEHPEGLRVVRMEAEHFGVQLRYIWTYTYDMKM